MKNGLYSVTTKGFDGVDWPPGGVFFLQNGVLLGGSSFMYYVGSYTSEKGIFKGECVATRIRLPQSVTFISTRRRSGGFRGVL